MKLSVRNCMVLGACLLATACSKLDEDQAEQADVALSAQTPGPTPFIANLALRMRDIDDLEKIVFTVAPRPGTYSRPVAVTYTRAWLDRNGAWHGADKRLAFAVFGLYANYQNAVTVTATFRDHSTHVEKLTLATPAFTGPAAVYNTPSVLTARGAAVSPGFDYFMVQNGLTTPAVIDTDGNLRWVGTGVADSYSSTFASDAFLVGSSTTPQLFRVKLDGTASSATLSSPRYLRFHHDLVSGKAGLLAELDGVEGGISRLETLLAEVSPTGEVLKEWDMAAIFRTAMQAGGDDPSNFVRDGVDWFHMNSAIYVAADDSLLVSSRENFVVKLDYATGRIKWILGDTSKHWYVDYPSLRALALKLTAGKPPVGQHSLSIASNGELLLFNNGYGSINQPPGTSPGITRDFSTPSRYVIDEHARTAAETWAYAPTPAIYSSICSSVYESAPGHHLVTYSVAAAQTRTKLIAVDNAGKIAFDFEYPSGGCAVAFIGQTIDFTGLTLK